MKRISIIILTLAALVALPLIITGCSCGGGTTLTDSDIATIKGFGARLDSHDQSIATIQNTLNDLDTATLDQLADLDADELTALLNLDLDTALTDIAQLKSDMSTLKGTTIPELDTRLVELENDQAGDSSDGGSSSSGEVTVILDVAEEPLEFMSGIAPISQVFPVKITNGTDEYQQVTFNITLRCVSTDYKADVDVDADYSMMVNTVAMEMTPVPKETDCQWVYFLWIDSNSIPVAPGKTTTVYATLSNFATSSGYEVWEVTLAGSTVTEL